MMADIEINTYGDLKQAIKSTDRKKTIKNIGGKAVNIVLGQLPFLGIAKDVFSLIKAAANREDSKKTNTWLDKLDIDDQVAAIVDDTVEDRFFKHIADKISSRNDEDKLEDDFDMNQELSNWLATEYEKRYIAGVPKANLKKENKEMDKKDKETLKIKLKKETSVTGTGASMTSGGDFVATKYAFGKSNNKGTPSDWKNAPSIPNRKSKAMDYKELWEVDEAYTPSTTNVEELARVEELLAQAHKDNAYSVMSSYEFRIKALRLLVALEKKYSTTLPFLKFGMSVVDYLNKYFPGFKGKFGPYAQNWKSVKDHIEQSLTQKDELNENYARFRNETKTRTKPEQFHTAVKEVKKKVQEINRLFEYMGRLQSELKESEGGLKTKKYTENALQQIKEATKQLFFKSTKLK